VASTIITAPSTIKPKSIAPKLIKSSLFSSIEKETEADQKGLFYSAAAGFSPFGLYKDSTPLIYIFNLQNGGSYIANSTNYVDMPNTLSPIKYIIKADTVTGGFCQMNDGSSTTSSMTIMEIV
jgi:hypothetical protein